MIIKVGFSSNNTMSKLKEKSFYTTENQTEFDLGFNLNAGCLIFIDGFKNNVNYIISNTKVIFETPFLDGTEITIISII